MNIKSFETTDVDEARRVLGNAGTMQGFIVQYRATHGHLHIQLFTAAGNKWHLYLRGCSVLRGETSGNWGLSIARHSDGRTEIADRGGEFLAIGVDFVLTDRAPVVPLDGTQVLSIVGELAARAAKGFDMREDTLSTIAAIASALESDGVAAREAVPEIIERLVRKHPTLAPDPELLACLQIGIY